MFNIVQYRRDKSSTTLILFNSLKRLLRIGIGPKRSLGSPSFPPTLGGVRPIVIYVEELDQSDRRIFEEFHTDY